MDAVAWLTFLAIVVALFGREFVSWLQRPNLKLFFDIQDSSCFHIFETRDKTVDVESQKILNGPQYPYQANCLLKITNEIRRWRILRFLQTKSAINVQAKVTYIFHEGTKYTYHPTYLNWSGGKFKESETIIAGSHHYLDFIRFRKPHFVLWFPPGYDGILYKFSDDGEYIIHFIINGENCGPYRFKAIITWSRREWLKPTVRIEPDKN